MKIEPLVLSAMSTNCAAVMSYFVLPSTALDALALATARHTCPGEMGYTRTAVPADAPLLSSAITPKGAATEADAFATCPLDSTTRSPASSVCDPATGNECTAGGTFVPFN